MSEWYFPNEQIKVKSDGTLVLGTGLGMSKEADYSDPQVELTYLLQDISQSHHFTVTISKIPVEFPTRKFGNFLPVKNISYSEITYENMSIPAGIFGNFPILHKKQVGNINLVLYDLANDSLEAKIRQWEAECFPKGRYVNFLSNIAAEFVYKSFTTTGKLNKAICLYVIPASSYTVSRSYEENNAKLINLSFAVVGFKGNIEEGIASSGGGVNPPKNLNKGQGIDLYSGGLINEEVTGNARFFGGGADA